MTRTGKSPQLLKANPEPFVEIHPADAELIELEEGDMVKLITRRGEALAEAKITDRIRQGSVFMPFHWGRREDRLKAANNLTSDAVDPRSKEPEMKACAVKLIPIPAEVEPEIDAEFELEEILVDPAGILPISSLPVAGD